MMDLKGWDMFEVLNLMESLLVVERAQIDKWVVCVFRKVCMFCGVICVDDSLTFWFALVSLTWMVQRVLLKKIHTFVMASHLL